MATSLPETGFVRLPSIIGPGNPLPISKTAFYAGINAGIYPKPVRLGPRIAAWKVEDLRAVIDAMGKGEPSPPRPIKPEEIKKARRRSVREAA